MTNSERILVKNVYYMLAYAFRGLNSGQFRDVAGEQFDHIHDLFAAIISKGVARQLKHGLYREYVEHADTLVTLRGKIDLPGTLKERIAQRRGLACEYDELSENNLLNQIVKTTALLLLRHGDVAPERQAALKKALMFFSTIDEVDLALVRWSRIRFKRHNKSYQLLISICRLIVEGMLISTTAGEYRLMSFIDDQEMSRLYEKFILEYYKKHHPELKPRASEIDWALDEGERNILPVMRSDIMLTSQTKTLIIDAKYYSKNMQVHFDRHTVHSSNLYQMFAYVKNAKATSPEIDVSGLLLYAETTAGIQPDAAWRFDGSNLATTTLNLHQDFAGITEKLEEIAENLLA